MPLSPPVTGASIASEAIIDDLASRWEIKAIGYQRGTLVSGRFSFRQAFRTIAVAARLIILRGRDAYYLVLSGSAWGNLRDLAFLLLLGREARERLTVHLHGSNWDAMMAGSSSLRRWLSRKLLGDVHRAIVLGETFLRTFKGYIPQERVVVVKNFFDDGLLISKRRLGAKWRGRGPIRILYLSNLIPEKGYLSLLKAFLALRRRHLLQRCELHFAGAFHSVNLEGAFREQASADPAVAYHGVVHGAEKRRLLWSSHIFCLPTAYRYEAQPISILESYAAGCVVLTTDQGGIKDIFGSPANGFYIPRGRGGLEAGIAKTLVKATSDPVRLTRVAVRNRAEAVARYGRGRFCAAIRACLAN